MGLRNIIGNILVAGHLLFYAPAAEIEKYDSFQNTFNPSYQQTTASRPSLAEQLETTGITLEDMAQVGDDYFGKKEETEEDIDEALSVSSPDSPDEDEDEVECEDEDEEEITGKPSEEDEPTEDEEYDYSYSI